MGDYKLYMVFDVESIGIHGQGFSYGYVVVDEDGNEWESGGMACPPEAAVGSEENRQWVQEHCPDLLSQQDYSGLKPKHVREHFWERWMYWHSKGAILCADVPWPVEARFLIDCVNGSGTLREREFDGPYPLIDIASVRFAVGFDPLATEPRLPQEEPAHDPIKDARQSARLLLDALDKVKGETYATAR